MGLDTEPLLFHCIKDITMTTHRTILRVDSDSLRIPFHLFISFHTVAMPQCHNYHAKSYPHRLGGSLVHVDNLMILLLRMSWTFTNLHMLEMRTLTTERLEPLTGCCIGSTHSHSHSHSQRFAMQPNPQNWDPTWGHKMPEASVTLPKVATSTDDISVYRQVPLGNLTPERAQRDMEELRRELLGADPYGD